MKLNSEQVEHTLTQFEARVMPKQPTPPPIRSDIYKLAPKQTWIGEVEASDER
jgi:hypothetical protein